VLFELFSLKLFFNKRKQVLFTKNLPQPKKKKKKKKMDINTNSATNLSKAAIVDWVNTSIDPPQQYTCVKDIQPKVAAMFMNDIFGDTAFPIMRGINFSFDADRIDLAVAKRNADSVLEGAQLLGFQPSFNGASWADGVKDFGGVLMFWRWLRQKSLEKPLSRVIPALELGLISSKQYQQQINQNNNNNADLPPMMMMMSKENNNNNRVVIRLSDIVNVAGLAEKDKESLNNHGKLDLPPKQPFMCGGPNGDAAKQLFESNWRELQAMRTRHEELRKAVGEGNLNKVIAALQAGHQLA
jgi:hypothetical protein